LAGYNHAEAELSAAVDEKAAPASIAAGAQLSTRPRKRGKLSHSSRDTWIAKQVAREIETAGAKAFLDEAEVDAGADFEEDILEFLERAHELVVLLTPWALDRPYVWAELGAAWGRRIPIVALLCGMTPSELQARPGTPVFLKKQNLLELNDAGRYFGQLKRRVQSHGSRKDGK